MSISPQEAVVETESRPATPGNLGAYLAAAVAALTWIALYGIFPYQHGHLDYRTSVLGGLWVMVTTGEGSEWIFCLFVPFIVGALVWMKRQVLGEIPVRPSNWALVPLVLSLIFYWLGYKADTRYMGFVSAQLMLAAYILWFLGPAFMRELFFPWLFFAFTWPFPPLEDMLAVPLRHLAAGSSVVMLNLTGLDTVREGTALISAADPERGLTHGALFRLDVENPCSGIRSLFSLIMISAFYGYISLQKFWQRSVLFLASIPLAVAGNVVRMLMLAWGSVLWGTEFAVGPEKHPSTFHTMSGVAVFIVALSGMFALSQVLELRSPVRRRKARKTGADKDRARVLPKIALWRTATVGSTTVALLLLCVVTPTSRGISDPGVDLNLPETLGEYVGIDYPMTDRERGILNEGVNLVRHEYRPFDGPSITATIVQSDADARSLHRPEVCLPGQGWGIPGRQKVRIDLADGTSIGATLLSLLRTESTPDGIPYTRRAFNIFFYVGENITVPTYHSQITRTLMDSMFKNLHHRWSMIGVFTSLSPAQSNNPVAGELEVNRLKKFVADLIPEIKSTEWH